MKEFMMKIKIDDGYPVITGGSDSMPDTVETKGLIAVMRNPDENGVSSMVLGVWSLSELLAVRSILSKDISKLIIQVLREQGGVGKEELNALINDSMNNMMAEIALYNGLVDDFEQPTKMGIVLPFRGGKTDV